MTLATQLAAVLGTTPERATAQKAPFHQPIPCRPYALAVEMAVPEPGRITYTWPWAKTGAVPSERSKTDVRR